MSDKCRLYLIKEKDEPQFTYLHPDVEFLAAGTEVINGQVQGRRVVIEEDVTYVALVEVIKRLNPRQKKAVTGTVFPTQELVDIVKEEMKKAGP